MKVSNIILICNIILTIFYKNISYADSSCIDYLSSSSAIASISDRQMPVKINTANVSTVDVFDPLSKVILNQLLEAGLIHSPFFEAMVYKAAGGINLSPNQIAQFEPAEIDELATKVYLQMLAAFKSKSTITNHLADPLVSRKVLMSLTRTVAIDKLGEALIVTGLNLGFIDYKKDIKVNKENIFNSGILSSIGLGVTGILFGVSNFWGFFYYYDDFYDQIIINYPAVISLSLSGLAIMTSAIASKFMVPSFVHKKILSKHSDIPRFSLAADPGNRLLPIEDLEPGQFLNRISQIDTRVAELRNPGENENLIVFGTDTTSLGAELINVFVNDLIFWVRIYETHVGPIKERLEQLRQGKVATSRTESSIVRLSQIIVEAAEATQQASATANKILDRLNLLSNHLDSIDRNSMTHFELRNFELKLEMIRTNKVVISQFIASLDRVHQMISNILESINRFNLAQSAMYVNIMGQQRTDDRNLLGLEPGIISNLLEQLEELESTISSVNSNP